MKLRILSKYWFNGILLMIWISVAVGFFLPKHSLLTGIIGYEFNEVAKDFIGKTGLFLVLLFSLLAYLISKFNITPEKVRAKIPKRKEKTDFASKELAEDITDDGFITAAIPEEPESSLEIKLETKAEKIPAKEIIQEIKVKKPVEPLKDQVEIEVEQTIQEDQLVENISNKLVEDFGEFDPTLELSSFKFPTLDLLKDYGSENITINQEELEANKNKIVDTLSNYKIGIASIKATIGPTVTLYEIVPEKECVFLKLKTWKTTLRYPWQHWE